MTQQILFEPPPELRSITHFRGRWGFLHNFFVEPDGTLVEREYQAEKCFHLADKKLFAGLNGRASKDLGQRVKQRADWKQIRVEVMFDLVLQKYQGSSRSSIEITLDRRVVVGGEQQARRHVLGNCRRDRREPHGPDPDESEEDPKGGSMPLRKRLINFALSVLPAAISGGILIWILSR